MLNNITFDFSWKEQKFQYNKWHKERDAILYISPFCPSILGKRGTQFVCKGFGISYNYVLFRLNEYTVGASQYSTREGVLKVYSKYFGGARDVPQLACYKTK